MPWFAKNTGSWVTLGYDPQTQTGTITSSRQGDANVLAAWSAFAALGWSPNAAAAVLGVCAYESGWNPWRWQSDILIASTDYYNLHTATTHGYGLNQFTPAWTYIGESSSFPGFGPNYLDQAGRPSDGNAQIYFIEHGCADLGYYFRWNYPQADYDTYPYIPFNDFKVTAITDFTYLVNQWLWNYSRGIAEHGGSLEMRVAAAQYAFTLIGGYIPTQEGKSWLYGRVAAQKKILARRRKLI